MRPHVELIQQSDLCWHPAELHGGTGRAMQRHLSYDEEDGSASTKIIFETVWDRPGGYHEADTEWFVLEGRVKMGNEIFGPGMYWRAPAGLRIPEMSVDKGTEVLIFREYGDWGFSVSEADKSEFIPEGGNTASEEPGKLTICDSSKMDWMDNIYEGDSQRFLQLKILYHDPSPEEENEKGFITLLGWAPPGWSDNRLIHHPVFEEAYTLTGHMEYNFGRFTPGTYFFRPAKVKHGHFVSGEEMGASWIFRLDGSLINWVTLNSQVIVKGDAVNYDPKTQAAVISGLPVRSKSTGPWDLDGQ
ncbi:MAG: DUF4437 domain-containing protein [Candidatus Thioglobus sp.]|nr:hypothetical protein [Gammaproteobacteria bacterium]MDP6163850.1 DUF4437 domain-containing protein [Candidatus Thioglobus sp.]MBQ08401.1 hypothetical protein [Gammaproteobacteria bacterium]HJL80900.1 DUF4437 domain-containing protein [Gammaproteobacteria bacterium]HJM08862.1 DUF4437 domain-containing protein [Gammaproteobacteria bacterium]|tara:strand:- start:13397 stop:14302 length:906 start_codon:yes stop_codon:yes gene_type:complete